MCYHIHMTKEKIVINWLLGLIATDGYVSKQGKSVIITTVEHNWVKNIVDNLTSVGIFTNVQTNKSSNPKHQTIYKVHAYGSQLYSLLEKYGEKEYCSERKYQHLMENISVGYKNVPYSKHDDDFIKENYKTMTDKEIAVHLKRSSGRVISLRRRHLGFYKRLPN